MTIRFSVKDTGHAPIARIVNTVLGQAMVYYGRQAVTHSAEGYTVQCSSRQGNRKGVATLNIRFNVNQGGRRAFANAVGEILGLDVVYNGTPTFGYSIGAYIVDREGALTFPNNIFHQESADLITALRERGYEVETDGMPDFQALQFAELEEQRIGRERNDPQSKDATLPSDASESGGTSEADPEDSDKLNIEMPLDGFDPESLDRLRKIVASKETLLKKAFGADDVPVKVVQDKVRFPWFTITGAEGEIDSYLRFITALCKMARESKRITAKEKLTENEKFDMRIFLIRLGFVGSEFKTARKILMRNLSGNSAWKAGQPPEQDSTHNSEEDEVDDR